MEDASEFIRKLIDAVDEELTKAMNVAQRLQPVNRGWESVDSGRKVTVRQPL